MTARALKPKPELAVTPIGVSQMNCAALLGIDSRRFLELVVPRCRNVAHVGKLRCVAVDEVQRALRELGEGAVGEEGETTSAQTSPTASGADRVLARLGYRRTGPAPSERTTGT